MPVYNTTHSSAVSIRYRSQARRKKTVSLAVSKSHKRNKLASTRTDLRTQAEKVEDARKRQRLRGEIKDALNRAQNVVMEEARKLHAQFQNHSVEHYHTQIMQHSRLTQSQRAPNRYNAFARSEVEKENSCAYYFKKFQP